MNCESDFVARTADFQQLGAGRAHAKSRRPATRASEAWLTDPNGPRAEARWPPTIAKLGENMAVPRFVRYAGKGYVGQRIHMGGKIGVQVEFARRHARESRPRRSSRRWSRKSRCRSPRIEPARICRATAVPADVLDKEKAIYRAQMEDVGQARERHRQDRRGQARQLLRAGRAARPAVDPRSRR